MLLARAARRRAQRDEVAIEVSTKVEKPQSVNQQEPQLVVINSLAAPTLPEDGEESCCELAAAVNTALEVGKQSISIDELKRLWAAKEPVVLLDVRTERSMEGVTLRAKGSVRMPPDHVAQRAKELGLQKEAWLIAYCA